MQQSASMQILLLPLTIYNTYYIVSVLYNKTYKKIGNIMSLQHAILGFLSYKPLSGYGLKKAFDRSVQHFWPANQSQIYRELSDLHESGFVTQEVIERENRLDKKIYHLTDTGREELHSWLAAPLPEDDFRDPFLIQLYFGGKLSDEELGALLEHEIQQVEERLAVYREMYPPYQGQLEDHEQPRAFFLSLVTLEYGLLAESFLKEWLESVLERLEDGDYTLREE